MKQIFFIVFASSLILSCKSSLSRAELLKENKALKERIKKLETLDTPNSKVALELKKMNVVYRGVSNPIYISKPNVLSFEATAPGLIKKDGNGNYTMNPRYGNSVDIKIKSILKNGDSLTEVKTMRVIDISRVSGTINSLGCGPKCELKLKKEELTNATIEAKVNDFLHDMDFKVTGFKIKMPHYRTLKISGNKMNVRANDLFTLLIPNDSVTIFDIKVKISGNSRYNLKGVAPITIKIIE